MFVVLIKPPSVRRGHARAIENQIIRRGFSILRQRYVQFTPDLLNAFYAEHRGNQYWGDIEKVMLKSGLTTAMLVDATLPTPRADVIAAFRTHVGESSNPAKCGYTTLRGIFGGVHWGGSPLICADNAIHASDSAVSADAEQRLIFPE